ncbi:MAG: site-specific DNA-methyltransferase [Candidatus Heimdallarchaeota archaeon]|nr:site-specific DNA-methyltransferase [Candidatus Heimdallarchaeota archaeon]MCK4612101.1 site-specific DNA-methyltransferase [Candidatus Heimdallarchaeota archaeon]
MKEFYTDNSDSKLETSTNQQDTNDFELEATTIWSFPDRGKWATHKGDYRGNFAPQIPRNVIERYSKQGDLVLDPMVGSGTTIIEAKLTGRNSIGIDINKKPLEIAKERISQVPNTTSSSHILFLSYARNLDKINDNSIDLNHLHSSYVRD